MADAVEFRRVDAGRASQPGRFTTGRARAALEWQAPTGGQCSAVAAEDARGVPHEGGGGDSVAAIGIPVGPLRLGGRRRTVAQRVGRLPPRSSRPLRLPTTSGRRVEIGLGFYWGGRREGEECRVSLNPWLENNGNDRVCGRDLREVSRTLVA